MAFRPMRSLALGCALALLSACSAPQNGVVTRFMVPTFRMQAADGTPQEGRAAVTPAGLAPGAVAPVHDGELTVKFAHLLGDRKLMATVSDVKSITIQLSGNGVSHTQTITEAQIVNGMTSFTFTGLPAGSLTVTIKALDGTGKVIGTDIQQATITGGQTTVVASTVMIAPTVTAPQVIVTGGSGGSGGGATGTLTTTVTLVDGAPVQNATLVAAYTNNVAPHAVTLVRDNQGNVWFTGGTITNGQTWQDGKGALKRVSAAGAVSTIDNDGIGTYALGSSADASRVYLTSIDETLLMDFDRGNLAFAPDGSPLALGGSFDQDWGSFAGFAVAGAPDGSIHIASIDTFIVGLALDGTRLYSELRGEAGSDLHLTSTGEPIYAFPGEPGAPSELVRFHADGSVAYDHEIDDLEGGIRFALDGQDNAWYALPSQAAVRKLSPTGVLLGSYGLPVRANAVNIDATGRIWAYQSSHTIWSDWTGTADRPSGAPDDLLMRLGTDGEVKAFYHLGLGVDVNDIVVTADDHLWVASPTKGLLHYTLPPAPGP